MLESRSKAQKTQVLA